MHFQASTGLQTHATLVSVALRQALCSSLLHMPYAHAPCATHACTICNTHAARLPHAANSATRQPKAVPCGAAAIYFGQTTY